ncbi:MAG: DinB family protein [Bacteroidetes bacterium]|nr:DinB family protein [Bacteroidota bacterium]
MTRPITGEAAVYFFKYIELAEGQSIKEIIENYSDKLNAYFQTIPEQKAAFAYAEGKWTVKEVLQHLIDTERVFVYRALCFARLQSNPLPSMDENAFAATAKTINQSLDQIKEEFTALRKSTDLFLLSLDEEELKRKGNAAGNDISVNALSYIIIGHLIHHMNILEERYF